MWRKYFIRHSEAIVLCLGLFLLQCTIYLPQTSFDLDRRQMVNNLAFSIIENSSVNQYIPFVKKASTDSKVTPELVLAVIVVENHVRPPTRRKIEEIFARSGLALTGKVPDISLGVGQVKISTARQILISKSFTDSQVIDSNILEFILNDKDNINLVLKYLSIIMDKQEIDTLDKDNIFKMLCIYHGYKPDSPFCPSLYEEVVWNIYQIIREKNYFSSIQDTDDVI